LRIALTYPDVSSSGGIERVVLECARFLRDRGHELHLISSRVEAGALPSGIHLHLVPSARQPAALAMPQYRVAATRALRRVPYDVHASFGSQSPGGGCFWVPSVHRAALDMILGRRGLAGRLRQRLNPDHLARLRLEEHHFQRRDYARLFACTETVRQELMSYHDVPPEDVELLPLGYRDSEFNATRRSERRAQARAELGLDDSRSVLLFVANELERKGFGELLEALPALRDPESVLLVVGAVRSDRYGPQLDRLGLRERVRFVGPSSDVGLYHAAAEAFVLPTLYEPWGLVIIEALASGVPVVTTELAGAASAVTRRNGRVVSEPHDVTALAAAIDEVLAGGVGNAAEISASVRHLSWPSILSRYERLLSEAST
jgi:UDP-glucose:(heptosyl)LPS alpha-1,3-glucosyltransferase